MIINKREYQLISEMSLGSFIKLSELMKDMGEDQLSLPLIHQFAGSGEKLKRFVCLALESVEIQEEGYDKWEDLQHITIPTLIEVVGDFFGLGGPLKTAFPDVSSLAGVLKPTPTTTSAN